MLDKSIEFHSIIMRHPNNRKPVLPQIPQGFSIRFYEKGYEQIDNETGKAVATANAWWTDVNGQKAGVVFGLSCLPEYQSKGLGRIAAAYMMDCFYRLMPGVPVWLDTQTWSYKAVGIYMDIGFIPMKTATYSDVPNEYDESLRTIRGKMREDKYKLFLELAE